MHDGFVVPILYWKDQFSTVSYFNLPKYRIELLLFCEILYAKELFVIMIGILSAKKVRKPLRFKPLSSSPLYILWP